MNPHDSFYGSQSMNFKQSFIQSVVFLFVCLCLSAGASARDGVADTIEKPLSDVAQKLALELQMQNITTLKMFIEEPFQLSSSLPNTIREVIGREFESAGITLVKSTAQRFLKITTKLQNSPSRAPLVSVSFSLRDASDQEVLKIPFKVELKKSLVLGAGLGALADGSNKQTGQSRPLGTGHIKNSLPGGEKPPKPHVDNGELRVHKDAMFALKVYVNGSLRSPSVDPSGYPKIRLNEGETYEVELINGARFPAAVALTIDGIDSGWFSGRSSQKVLWIVDANSRSRIKGWLTPDGGQKFEVSPPDESVAASLDQIGEVGVIQATFFRAYKPSEPKDPADRGGVGTKLGDPFEWKVRSVNLVRGKKARALISIRYDKN